MSRTSHFPPEITRLEEWAGQFQAHRLEAKDCDVLFATYPGDSDIDEHSHPSDNIGVITKGELILTVDGETKRYGPGDWYHVPANTPHSARFDVDSAEIEFWFKS